MKLKRATITLEIPKPPIDEFLALVHDFASQASNNAEDIGSKAKNFFSNKNGKNTIKKFAPLVGLGLIIALALFVILRFVGGVISQGTNNPDSRAKVVGPSATYEINKDFFLPILDDKGKELTKLKYSIEKADLRNQIIVNGQRADAVAGKTFLVLSIKLTNNFDKPIEINTRDYVRLSVNGSTEMAAADIHNDPVNIRPISTKATRIGFPINDTDKGLVLQFGEVKGKKQEIKLNFTNR